MFYITRNEALSQSAQTCVHQGQMLSEEPHEQEIYKNKELLTAALSRGKYCKYWDDFLLVYGR